MALALAFSSFKPFDGGHVVRVVAGNDVTLLEVVETGAVVLGHRFVGEAFQAPTVRGIFLTVGQGGVLALVGRIQVFVILLVVVVIIVGA